MSTVFSLICLGPSFQKMTHHFLHHGSIWPTYRENNPKPCRSVHLLSFWFFSTYLWFKKVIRHWQKYITEPRRDFQQCGILTSVDSVKPVQPLVKLRNSKVCLVSSLTVIEYSSNQQRLWSVCAYAQAGLSFCWSNIPHFWKSHVMAHTCYVVNHGSEVAQW